MLSIVELRSEFTQKQTFAKALLDRTTAQAQAEGRVMTDTERGAIQRAIDDAKQIKARLDRAQGDENITAAIASLTDGMIPPGSRAGGRGGRSLGQAFTASDVYRQIREQATRRSAGARLESDVFEMDLQATTLSEAAGSGGPLVVPDYQPGILPLPTRRLVVADLIAPGTTTSNLVSFMQETTFTNAAAPVAEAGLKPESTLVFAATSQKVEKIAHWIPVTDEILQDVAQMSSYIDARMRLGIDLAEDDALLNGSGVSPALKGFLHLGAPAAPVARVAEVNADAIYTQIALIEAATNLAVDGIVMNPANWKTIQLAKDSTGNYIGGGGPFATPRVPTLWGRPVAVTPAIVANTALVGSFHSGGAQLFKHGGTRVDVSNSHASFFINNLLAVRAEIRESLVCYRESAFGLITNLN
jgi:HK97 family phage major capsid protein